MLFVSYFAITMMNVAFYETIMTVVLYSSKGGVMAISVKPVLISEKQMEAIRIILFPFLQRNPMIRCICLSQPLICYLMRR